jgi:hypothetical protein
MAYIYYSWSDSSGFAVLSFAPRLTGYNLSQRLRINFTIYYNYSSSDPEKPFRNHVAFDIEHGVSDTSGLAVLSLAPRLPTCNLVKGCTSISQKLTAATSVRKNNRHRRKLRVRV